MPAASTTKPGRAGQPDNRARLLCGSLAPLILPWWPDELEKSGAAPSFAEDPRPRRAPVLTRGSDPLPSIRLPFTLTGPTIRDSIQPTIELMEKYAKAKPVVQLMMGRHDRGPFHIVDLSWVESQYAASGQPSKAAVTLTLREAVDVDIPIGPVRGGGRG